MKVKKYNFSHIKIELKVGDNVFITAWSRPLYVHNIGVNLYKATIKTLNQEDGVCLLKIFDVYLKKEITIIRNLYPVVDESGIWIKTKEKEYELYHNIHPIDFEYIDI